MPGLINHTKTTSVQALHARVLNLISEITNVSENRSAEIKHPSDSNTVQYRITFSSRDGLRTVFEGIYNTTRPEMIKHHIGFLQEVKAVTKKISRY
jgi:hypothetical protein